MGRSGQWVENLSGEAAYRSFQPAPLPPSPPLSLDDETTALLLKASRSLQKLDAFARYVPNADLFVSAYVRKEALLPPQRRARDSLHSLFSYVEQHPIYTIGAAREALDMSYNSAAAATKKLVDLGIVKEVTNAARNRVFVYEDYLGIIREGTE